MRDDFITYGSLAELPSQIQIPNESFNWKFLWEFKTLFKHQNKFKSRIGGRKMTTRNETFALPTRIPGHLFYSIAVNTAWPCLYDIVTKGGPRLATFDMYSYLPL